MSAPTGNDNAIRSGLYLRAPNGIHRRDRVVARLARKVERVMPWLEPSDRPAIRAWAQLEILSDAVFQELRQRGVLNTDGEPRRLLDDYMRLRRAQFSYANALGMTPTGRASLKSNSANSALDLVSLMQGANEPLDAAPAAPDDPEPESK